MQNLQEFFEDLEWTSDDGKGKTSFQSVYTYPSWLEAEGYPFVVILDSTGSGESIDNMTLEFNTVISVSICINYGTIDKQSDEEKIEEVMLRLREAWDYVKTQLFTFTTMQELGVDWTYNPAYLDDFDDELNLYKRTFNLIVKETISRG